MQRKLFVLILLLFLISNISASCEEGQIDINTASESELDNLYGIGPVKAEAIVDARPFDSVDNLIDVWGIGEATLTKIKEQGLACVEDSEEEGREIEAEQEEIIEKSSEEIPEELVEESVEEIRNIQGELIALNPKDIKSENSTELNKSNFAIYGFVGFCILLGILFLFKKNKYKKNEFK